MSTTHHLLGPSCTIPLVSQALIFLITMYQFHICLATINLQPPILVLLLLNISPILLLLFSVLFTIIPFQSPHHLISNTAHHMGFTGLMVLVMLLGLSPVLMQPTVLQPFIHFSTPTPQSITVQGKSNSSENQTRL